MMRNIVVLALVLFVALSVDADDVYLLSGVESCPAQACRFENASLWSTGVVPSSNDTVHLVWENKTLTFTLESRVEVHSFFASTVNLTVLPSGSLIVQNILSVDQASFDIHGILIIEGLYLQASQLTVTGNAEVGLKHANATIVDDFSQLTVLGTYVSTSNSTFAGPVYTGPTSAFASLAYTYLRSEANSFLSMPYFDELNLADNKNYSFEAGLSATLLNIPTNTKVDIYQAVLVSAVQFEDTTATLNLFEVGSFAHANTSYLGPLVGDGRLFIQSSNITISNPSEEAHSINATIVMNGTSNNIFLNQFVIDRVDTFSVADYETYVIWSLSNITFNEKTELRGDTMMYGAISLNNASLSTNNITVGDGATVTLNKGAALVASSTIISHGGSVKTGDDTAANGDHFTSKVTGPLINNGTLSILPPNVFVVDGSYFHSSDALLKVYVDHPSYPTDALWVSGDVQIDGGHLQVVVRTDQSATFVIIASNSSVNGSFQNSEGVSDRDIPIGKVDLHYSNHTLEVVYTPALKTHKSFWDTPWPYVIFIGGGGVIIAIVAFFLIRRHRQKKYHAIP